GPDLEGARRPPRPTIKQKPRPPLHRRWTLRGLLVTGQVAFSMVLLVTSFLFLRNLARTHAAAPGFETSNLLVAEVSLVEQRHTVESRTQLLQDAATRIEALPGFARASFSRGIPLTIRHGATSS